jgi:AbiV family abortive infection protein
MKKSSELKKTRTACLQNAETFVNATKKLVKNNKFRHIQYHLAALALEEIGKAEIIGMQYIAGVHKREPAVGGYDDHIKKLFWALWGPSFGKNLITKEQIEQYKGLASIIHRKRLAALYVDPEKIKRFKINKSEVDQILSLANARLKMEQNKDFVDPDDPNINKEEMSWFLNATEDEEKRRLIFGKKSQDKLIKMGDVKKWVHWLKQQFDKNDAEIREIIKEELQRKKPKGKDAKKPKYKIRIRINSESHSIRNKELKKWNENIDLIKLYSDDKRDLICDFYLPKSTHIRGTWYIGWGMARTFVTALNIATKGFFWWHVPKDRSRFYEDMWDLERKMRMGAERKPELTVNFKDLHWVLRDSDLGRTSMIFYYITKVRDKEEGKPFNDYVLGLSFLAKSDIHLRFELNAFAQFFQALKNAFRISGDWDGKSEFKVAVHKQFAKLKDFTNLDEYLRWGEEQELSPEKKPSKNITLTEVFGMKLYAEVYLEILAKRALDSLKRKRKTEAKN